MVEFLFDSSTKFFFPSLASSILQAMDKLHQEQVPPYSKGLSLAQIRRRFMEQKWSHKVLFSSLIEPIFTLMGKYDFYFANPSFSAYATQRLHPNYKKWSEIMAEKYPGYLMAESGHIVNKSDIVIDLDDLIKLLRSKDMDFYEQYKDKFFSEHQSRYLTGTANEQQSILYVTYPRSGNSLLRKYFENVTGTVSGSDMVLKHLQNIALQFSGFKGEGRVDNSCWFKKSHFPLTFPFQPSFESDMAVICTRYQMDVDPSFFLLVYTCSHNVQVSNSFIEDPIYPYWKNFQEHSTRAYNLWFNYWLKMAEESDKMIYFFRFEDVLMNPREELAKLFKFILGIESIEGTVIERRIDETIAMGSKKNQAYKPRVGGANKNLKNYRPEQLDYMKEVNEDLFHVFGYADMSNEKEYQNIPNDTPFMDFEGKATPENKAKFNYYKTLNQKAFEKRLKMKHGDLPREDQKIRVGGGEQGAMKTITQLNIFSGVSLLDQLDTVVQDE